MSEPIISIIVPVYNVDRYLSVCLDSIKAQTFKDWECILIDDGSTDSSPLICDRYAAEDARFKVIHRPNGGVSSARNAGLETSAGDYLGFVDADDWVDPEMFELLYRLITEHNADIAQVGCFKEYKGRRQTKRYVSKTEIMDGLEAIRKINFDRLPNYVCNKLHRRSIITCSFPEGRTFEDMFVYGRWLRNVGRMVVDPTPLYHYRMRKGSIIHTDVAKNRYDYFLSCIDSMDGLNDILQGEKETSRINAYINKAAVNAGKNIARNEKNRKLRDATILRISSEVADYPLPPVGHTGLKLWLRSKILRNHPKCFVSLMRAVHLLDFDVRDREKRYFD